MISKFAMELAKYAVKKHIIKQDEIDLYHYAYLTLIEKMLSWGLVVVIGYLTGCFWGAITFLLTFIPLRSYAGGYHANGYLMCFLMSTLSFITMIYIYKSPYQSLSEIYLLIILFVSAVFVFILSPLEDKNKPLDHKEAVHYRRKARYILLTEVCMICFLWALSIAETAVAFMYMSIVMEAILIALGYIKNKMHYSKRKTNMNANINY